MATVTMGIQPTMVTSGRMVMRPFRLNAARQRRLGLQIMSFEQLAMRLAGGFVLLIDCAILRMTLRAVSPTMPLGELDSNKLLPSKVDALCDTLHRVWRAGVRLASRAQDNIRFAAIARFAAFVSEQLPPGMTEPRDLVAVACRRLDHAAAVLAAVAGCTHLPHPSNAGFASRSLLRWQRVEPAPASERCSANKDPTDAQLGRSFGRSPVAYGREFHHNRSQVRAFLDMIKAVR